MLRNENTWDAVSLAIVSVFIYYRFV